MDDTKGHLTRERQAAAEIICREMGRAVFPWTVTFKQRAQWPADYIDDERKRLIEGAWATIASLEAAGFVIAKP